MKTFPVTFLLAASLAGCYVETRAAYVPPPEPYVEPAPAVEVAYTEPASYVYINPNVQVIENYDYPVFLYGGLYYRYDGGVWYSSAWHDRGWAVSANTPTYIASIDRPSAYVHFHADVNARPGMVGYRATTRPVITNRPAQPPRYAEQPGRASVVGTSHPIGGAAPPPRGAAPPPRGAAPPPRGAAPPPRGAPPPPRGAPPPPRPAPKHH